MATLDSYLDDLLARGRAYFSRDAALAALGFGRSDHALDQEAPLGESQARLLSHPAPGRPNRQRARPREVDRPADEASGDRLPYFAAARGGIPRLVASGQHGLPCRRPEAVAGLRPGSSPPAVPLS